MSELIAYNLKSGEATSSKQAIGLPDEETDELFCAAALIEY